MPQDQPGPGGRLSDAEREHAAELVRRAHDEGRISRDELDRRLAGVYGATVPGELGPLLATMPMPIEPELTPGPAVELGAGDSDLERSGHWLVPPRLLVEQSIASRGRVVLDFRAAEIGAARVEVELRLGLDGSALLLVPEGASADLGDLRGPGPLARTDVPHEPGGGVHFVVSGRASRRRSVKVVYTDRRWWALR
jgi:hypothetical protein